MNDSVSRLVELVTSRTGIELSRGGLREALARYAKKRMAELELASFEEFKELLDSPDAQELNRLIEIISVPHTWFFRDKEQLDVVSGLLAELGGRGESLSLWVPGCATGEDAYSLALIAESLGIDARIYGSDLCEQALEHARRATYGPFSVRALPEKFRYCFRRRARSFELAENVRRRVTFVRHNLLDAPLFALGGWHLILCRNVFIYFSGATSESCAARLGASLHPDGVAVFGAGELIGAQPEGLVPESLDARIVFRRTDAQRSQPGKSPLGARGAARIRPIPPLSSEPLNTGLSELRMAPKSPLLVPKTGGGPLPIAVLEKAQQELSSSSESPMDPLARMLAGIALYSTGDYELAFQELRAASLLDEELWPAAIYQGMCLENMGLPHLARAEYRHAVRLLEANPERLSFVPEELSGLGPDLLELARRKCA